MSENHGKRTIQALTSDNDTDAQKSHGKDCIEKATIDLMEWLLHPAVNVLMPGHSPLWIIFKFSFKWFSAFTVYKQQNVNVTTTIIIIILINASRGEIKY